MTQEKSADELADAYMALQTENAQDLRRFLAAVPDVAWRTFGTRVETALNEEKNAGGMMTDSVGPDRPLMSPATAADLPDWLKGFELKERVFREVGGGTWFLARAEGGDDAVRGCKEYTRRPWTNFQRHDFTRR